MAVAEAASIIKILQWNSRSIRNKMVEFSACLDLNRFDIVAVQESWLKPKHNTPYICSYDTIRKDRPNVNRKAGGLLIFIKNNLHYIEKPIQEYPNGSLEIQGITLITKEGNIDLMNFYNPFTILSKIEFCHYLNQMGRKYIIVGDINAHHSLWEPLKDGSSNQSGRILYAIIQEEIKDISLATPPNLHTYTNSRTGEKSTIDHVLCNNILLPLLSIRSLAGIGSDHIPIQSDFIVGIDKTARGKKRKWIFDDNRWNDWQRDIGRTEMTPGTVREEVKQFTDNIITVSKDIFKMSSNKVKNKFNKPWWTQECRKTIAIRRRARRKMERNGTMRNIIEYRKAAAKATKVQIEAKRMSLRQYVSKINPDTTVKEVWDMMRKFRGKQRIINCPLLYENRYCFTKDEKAKTMEKHYQKVMSKEENTIYNEEDLNRIEAALNSEEEKPYNERFSMRELKMGITDIPTDKTFGIDEIHNLFLKKLPDNKVECLLGIINRSWRLGIIPEEWKTAVIIPIPKPEKNLELPGSYRPISLLSCLSKLVENMIAKRLKYIAESEGLFSENQFGFRFRRGTVDPIIGLENEIHTGINNKKVTIVVFFYIKSAYDTVDHTLLLNMLASKGIVGTMLRWIKEFLEKRKIQVNIEDIMSEALEVNMGVPQGSGISSLFFDFILSNIPQLAPVRSKEFADDVAFSVTADTYEMALIMMQDAIDRFEEYISSVGLKISTEKTKAMCFTLKKQRQVILTLNNSVIEVVKEFKYLGMYLDAPRLTWSKHIQYIRNKSQQGLNVIKYVSSSKWGADRGSLLKFNSALVKSKLTYGCQALVSTSTTNYKKLEPKQNQGLRLATGCLKNTYIPALQAEADVIPLDLYIKKQAVKYHYKMKMQDNSHSIKKILFNEQEYDLNLVYNERSVRKPFKLKTLEIIREWRLPTEPNFKNLKYPCIPPWEDLEGYICTELLIKVTKKQSEAQLKQAALETLDVKYSQFLKIYTDGSKISQPMSTTAAFCVPSRNFEEYWKLHPHISIEGAELSAIVKALEWVKNLNEAPKATVILTDYKVSLQLMLHRKPKSYEFGVHCIHEYIRDLYRTGWQILFQYIPSHCGVRGNCQADSLANLAHNSIEIIDYPLERKEIDVLVEKAAKRQWDIRWRINRRECELGSRKLVLEDWKWCRLKSRVLDVAITRLRVGNCRLRYYMYIMKLTDSPICQHCDLDVDETVTHFLIECSSLVVQRNILKRRLSNYGIVRLTSDMLLGSSNENESIKFKITEELARFLINTKRLEDI